MPSNGSWLLTMDRMNPGALLIPSAEAEGDISPSRKRLLRLVPVAAYQSASVRAGAENGGEVCTPPSASAEMSDSLLALRRVEG